MGFTSPGGWARLRPVWAILSLLSSSWHGVAAVAVEAVLQRVQGAVTMGGTLAVAVQRVVVEGAGMVTAGKGSVRMDAKRLLRASTTLLPAVMQAIVAALHSSCTDLPLPLLLVALVWHPPHCMLSQALLAQLYPLAVLRPQWACVQLAQRTMSPEFALCHRLEWAEQSAQKAVVPAVHRAVDILDGLDCHECSTSAEHACDAFTAGEDASESVGSTVTATSAREGPSHSCEL